jgi:hypothetical protein
LAVSAELIRRRIGCDFTARVSDGRFSAVIGKYCRSPFPGTLSDIATKWIAFGYAPSVSRERAAES